MKIMHFIHGLNTGGAETLVKDYVLNIDKKQFEPVVLCFNHYPESPYERLLEDNNIKVIYVSDYLKLKNKKNIISRFINKISRYYLVKRIIKNEMPDIIHTHLQVNKYIKFAKPPKSTKLFHTMHGEPQRYLKSDKGDFSAIRWLIKKYDMKIICLHDQMMKEVNELFDVNNSIVLNNGINLDSFKHSKSQKIIRKELSIPEGSFVIGHVGRFNKIKNHDLLVDIFNNIHNKNKDAFLLLVGDGEEKKRIQDKLNSVGLEKNYLILSNRSDIPDLLNAMDVFAFPSLSEGLGISLIEAQEAGLACFISSVVPDGAIISNYVEKIDLDLGAGYWADKIVNYKFPPKKILKDEDWDIKKIVKHLEKIYKGEINENKSGFKQ